MMTFWPGALVLVAIVILLGILWFVEKRLPEKTPKTLLPDGRLMDTKLVRVIGTHSWGRSVRKRFNPEEYEGGELKCLSCSRFILAKQWYWETPLVDSGGLSFAICLSCQPGDAEATHGA
jgi:hypothetical protein